MKNVCASSSDDLFDQLDSLEEKLLKKRKNDVNKINDANRD